MIVNIYCIQKAYMSSPPAPTGCNLYGCENVDKHGWQTSVLTIPPAAHAATTASCPSSFSILLAAVITSLTPVAPNG